MTTLKQMGIRLCLFRKSDVETFTCYCDERGAWAALNFVRFLD